MLAYVQARKVRTLIKSHQEPREQLIKRVLEQNNQAVALMDQEDGGPAGSKKRLKRKDKALVQRNAKQLCKDRARAQNQSALKWVKKSPTAMNVDTSDAVALMKYRWLKDIVP